MKFLLEEQAVKIWDEFCWLVMLSRGWPQNPVICVEFLL